MIAFHLIISAYGFWLPNDPRGSWSDFVAAWELYKFGPATKVDDRRSYAKDAHDVTLRRAAKEVLNFPPVRFNDVQRRTIGAGFAKACADSKYRCLACHVGFDHSHLVYASHLRKVPIIARHLKGAATHALTEARCHPLVGHTSKRGGLPTPWSEGCWKVFIDEIDQLRNAIAYVERHASKEGLPAQNWSFIQPVDPDTLLDLRSPR